MIKATDNACPTCAGTGKVQRFTEATQAGGHIQDARGWEDTCPDCQGTGQKLSTSQDL